MSWEVRVMGSRREGEAREVDCTVNQEGEVD